MDYF